MMNDNTNGNITLLTFVDSCGRFGVKPTETLKTSHTMINVQSNIGWNLKTLLRMVVIRTSKGHCKNMNRGLTFIFLNINVRELKQLTVTSNLPQNSMESYTLPRRVVSNLLIYCISANIY